MEALMEHVPHQILVQTREGVWEASRRLREHGYEPVVAWADHPEGLPVSIRVHAAEDEQFEFLRPDFLPPEPSTKLFEVVATRDNEQRAWAYAEAMSAQGRSLRVLSTLDWNAVQPDRQVRTADRYVVIEEYAR